MKNNYHKKQIEKAIEDILYLLRSSDWCQDEVADYQCAFCLHRPENNDAEIWHKVDCSGLLILKLLRTMQE